ncbi:hypothetical protein X994_6339 (plasmid) [Burkholderia pseudomallei]|uniref:hypothetical protein n=1 Tax=Burkholderia pseudomallei TaxID=28450 RepID=UPI00052A7899|nr:hypothetical protein [Burkholderia pseudomallei]AIV73702.1 hypothetical protein X994_6339 [Burkholderia pseudomallei]
MSVWDDFHKLSVLKIGFLTNSAAKSAAIYGNGKNQVAVVLHATVLGKDGKPLAISYDELLAATHLIDYSTGEKINWTENKPYNKSPWSYTNIDWGYSNPGGFDLAVQDSPLSATEGGVTEGVFVVTYYLYSSQLSSGLDVGVGINIPGVGEFNTTADGTGTHNSPGGKGGSVFKSPSFVHVKALDKIDYSLSSNLRVNNNPASFSSFDTVVSDMLVVHNNFAHINYHNNEGTSSKTTVIIAPAQNGLKFSKIDVLSHVVDSGFKLAGGGCDTVWGVGGANYDATFIFVNKKHYGLLSDNVIHAECGQENYYYTIGTKDDRHHWTEDLSDGVITVHICC